MGDVYIAQNGKTIVTYPIYNGVQLCHFQVEIYPRPGHQTFIHYFPDGNWLNHYDLNSCNKINIKLTYILSK